jgi:hypothetical protein
MKEKLLKLQERLDSIDGSNFEMEELDTLQNEVISIEDELDELACCELEYYKDKEFEEMDNKISIGDNNYSTFYQDIEKNIRNAIKEKKEEMGFLDPEAELDRLYPNGDEDFFSED